MAVVPLGLGMVILTESALSLPGFGVPPPTPSWGAMLSRSGRTTGSRPRGWPLPRHRHQPGVFAFSILPTLERFKNDVLG